MMQQLAMILGGFLRYLHVMTGASWRLSIPNCAKYRDFLKPNATLS